MLVGLHFWETRQKDGITRETLDYTSKSIRVRCFLGLAVKSGSRARRRLRNLGTSPRLMIRFKRFEGEFVPTSAVYRDKDAIPSQHFGPKVPIG